MTAAGLKRLMPRFSLRTLVVFTLLVTSGTGLWWHWEAWPVEHVLPAAPGVTWSEMSADGRWLNVDSEMRCTFWNGAERSVWDLGSGVCVSREKFQFGEARSGGYARSDASFDGKRAVGTFRWPEKAACTSLGETRIELTDAVTGERLGTLTPVCFLITHVQFLPDGRRLLVVDCTGNIHIYRRRRPEWWWGVFYLWEFWLTAAFAGVFFWSVWRDRRVFRHPPSPQPSPPVGGEGDAGASPAP